VRAKGLLIACLCWGTACASQETALNAPGSKPSAATPTALAVTSSAPTLPLPPPSGSANAAPASSSATAPGSAAPASSGAEATPRIDEDNVYAPGRQATSAVPPLLDEAGKPLPQTPERPKTTSTTFGARMALLGQAISSGNADAALPAFFPVVAYAQVKDIPSPEGDWEQRLVSAFRRDIAEYRKKLGDDAEKATLVSVAVPEQTAKLMKPGSEGNRVGYYRVLRSTLHFRLANGEEKTLELTSMISWRGEWYVVHLHGFK
jgi:hypothetical protein